MANNHKTKFVVFILTGILFVLLFVGGPDHYSSRSYRNGWDLGHIIFFALLNFSLLNYLGFCKRKSLIYKIIFFALFSLFFGFAIELIQLNLARTSELGDVERDVIGGLIPVFFSQQESLLKKSLLIIMRACIIVIAVYQLTPLALSLIDEFSAQKQFPVLSDLESSLELSRWTSESELEIDDSMSVHGQMSLKVPFDRVRYSGVTLKYFPSSWKGYNTLNMSVHNPLDTLYEIEMRLQDLDHVVNGHYNDRFNKVILLKPGWNNLEIKISDIENSPKNRKMDLDNIESFRLFIAENKIFNTLHIDNVYLK